MGLEIPRESFEEAEFAVFSEKLKVNLRALELLLRRPGFGEGSMSIGAELELNLVDSGCKPALVNAEVLDRVADERLTLEVNRFNLEINARPSPLAGRPFSAMHAELGHALAVARRGARGFGARVAAIGILPTLELSHLSSSALTDAKRYRALAAGLLRIRGEAFDIHIEGEDEVSVRSHDVTFEGANTSLQVHLRVAPEAYGRTYNAAQAATAVVLAAASNSPIFLGRRLWHETRVALFRQSVDDRGDATRDDWRPARVSFGHGWVRQGAQELFEEAVSLHEPVLPVLSGEDPLSVVEAGGVPQLEELRLHHGTVWRWNRAVYDPGDGGHLRIEMRALPAGPSVRDTVANAAFMVGLTLGLAPRMDEYTTALTFGHARRNFYEAARHGLGAELLWPESVAPSPRGGSARDLALRLLPVAREGLLTGGVEAAEADAWLAIIAERITCGVTGAVWQREAYARALAREPALEALCSMLERYLALSEADAPVHTWPRD
jgi:gamma-glutamyl:cysteine ligase YbdK (ATP-grasp superfamily)